MSQQWGGVEGRDELSGCRIVLADDHELMREGIGAVLAREPDFTICGVAADPMTACSLVASHRPDVLLIDLSMTEHERPELLHDLTSHFPGTRVLVLAAYAEERCVARVLNQGASGYFVKSASAAHLVEAVRAIAAGEIHASPRVASVMRRFGRPPTMADASIQHPARSV